MFSVNVINVLDFSLQLTCSERYRLPPTLREQSSTQRKTSQR